MGHTNDTNIDINHYNQTNMIQWTHIVHTNTKHNAIIDAMKEKKNKIKSSVQKLKKKKRGNNSVSPFYQVLEGNKGRRSGGMEKGKKN